MSPQPPRQPGWTCDCGTWNESFRITCRNASRHTPPEPEEPPKKGRQ